MDTSETGPQNTKLSILAHIISIYRWYGEWYNSNKASSSRKRVKKHILWMSFHIWAIFFLASSVNCREVPNTLAFSLPANCLIVNMSTVQESTVHVTNSSYKSKNWPSDQDEKMGKYIILWALSHFLTHFICLVCNRTLVRATKLCMCGLWSIRARMRLEVPTPMR